MGVFKMNARILHIAAIAVVLCTAPWAARGNSVIISFEPISGAPGSTVDVIGTIVNTGPDVLNLDSDNESVSAPLTVTDEFLNNAPFTLNSGASATFEFFTITIAADANPGLYGTDHSDAFSFLGDFNSAPIEDVVNFEVNVTSPAVATPELGSPLLLISALIGFGLGGLGLRRRLLPAGK
jgi:hypothetical protein